MTSPRASEHVAVPPETLSGDAVSSGDRDAEGISVVSVVNVLLRHRWMILTLALAFGLYTGVKSLRAPRLYSTVVQFMPKGTRAQGQLGGIAAQLGIVVGGGDPAQSPQFYIDLLDSKPLLWPIAQKTYTVRTDTGVVTGDIIRIFGMRGRQEVRRARAIGFLQGAISAGASSKTGVITVTARATKADLSFQLARNLLEQVNVYNLTRRQQQAVAERAFVERQMGEKRTELRHAEDELKTFLERNRSYRLSPELELEYDRLRRAVDMRQQIYTSLVQAFETVRIEEVRDLPVITVVQPAEYPLDVDRREGQRKTLVGILAGFVLGAGLAFLRDRVAANKAAQSAEFLEFTALKRQSLEDLLYPWRPLARLFRSRARP